MFSERYGRCFPAIQRREQRGLHGHVFHLKPVRIFNLASTSQSRTSDNDLVEHDSGYDHLGVKRREQLEMTRPCEIDERPGIGHDDHATPSWLSSRSRSAAG